MKNTVIIVAGGSGTRMGTSVPKQFLEINNKPVIIHTIEKFYFFDRNIHLILVISSGHRSIWDQISRNFSIPLRYEIAIGGQTRYHSVKNGLNLVKEESLVGIHDAVRPLIRTETIADIYREAANHGNAVPCVPVRESVREIKLSGSRIIDRKDLTLVQTPQVFLYTVLKKAYKIPYSAEFTDDASLVERSGVKIHLVQGDLYNIKITSPEDLEIAGRILG
jgi:2-C-methyl-D-erythritol 4-phosphate cytidylyltransferase